MRFTGIVAFAAAGLMAVQASHVPAQGSHVQVARAADVPAPAAGAALEARQYSGLGSLGGKSRLLNYLHCLLFDILNAQSKNLPIVLAALRNTLDSLGRNPPTPAIEQAIAQDLIAIKGELKDTIDAILGIRQRPAPSGRAKCSTLKALSRLLSVLLRELRITLEDLERNPIVADRFAPEIEAIQGEINRLLTAIDALQIGLLSEVARDIEALKIAIQRAGLGFLNIIPYAAGLP